MTIVISLKQAVVQQVLLPFFAKEMLKFIIQDRAHTGALLTG